MFRRLPLALVLLLGSGALLFAKEEYQLGPDSQEQADVPKGKVEEWTWNSDVVPGRPLGSPAVMPTRWPGLHQPSSTTRRAHSRISSSVISKRRIDEASTPHISPHRRTVSRPGDSA